jgi:DNA-binding FadR family transcriptional regulator
MFLPAEKKDKISDRVIDQIRDGILRGKFKAGEFLGSEKDLLADFGVSKASIREALRVLEVMGLVEIKTGASGGIYVAEVDEKATIYNIINILHHKSPSPKEITMIRYILEPIVARIAAEKINQKDIDKLKNIITGRIGFPKARHPSEIGFHRYLPRVTQSPLLITIMDFVDTILNNLKSKLNLETEFFEQIRQMHLKILGCLIQRDGEGAAKAIAHDVLEVGNYISDLTKTPRFDPSILGRLNYLLEDNGEDSMNRE